MNQVSLLGRFTKDPELQYTANGNAVAHFTIAVPRRYTNSKGEKEADFVNCLAWRKTAEFIASYFKKGQMILLQGRIQTRHYDGDDGVRRWITEVITEAVDFAGDKPKGIEPPASKELDAEIAEEDLPF